MYPRVVIDLDKFKHNVSKILELSHQNKQTMMMVTKVFCADQRLVDVLNELDIDYIADSRIFNFKNMVTSHKKVLLRLPQLCEVEDVVKYTDISLNSELKTINLLNDEAIKQETTHSVILMIDLGDLREGIFDKDELLDTVKEIESLQNIHLEGIGTNLTCYGGVIPTPKTLNKLVEFRAVIETLIGRELNIVSGGNSSNILLLEQNKIPRGINNVRMGESIVLGRETAYGDLIENVYDDVFTLEASIIELKTKPSAPIGELGMNAFGEKVTFEDTGDMLRAILAIGKQDVSHENLIPIDNVSILGSSSDHLLLDVSNESFKVGDVLQFKLTYGSVLSLMTSKYVEKFYV